MSRATFGLLPWRSRSQHDLSVKSCPAHNFVIWSQILQLFYIIDHHRHDMSSALLGSQPWRSRSQHDLSAKLCPVVTLLFEVDLKTISHEWSPYWDDMSSATFRLLPWRSRSQQDLTAKTCPAHYIVIWSRILHLFYTNDHHIETTCCMLHLGRCLEGQGHSMTFQHNCVRPITLLFKVLFKNYFT